MRFVAVKNEEQQAAALVFHPRNLALRPRNQLADAVLEHLAEYG